ncbi:MAG: hypothetical protein DRP90_08030 [Planctomycetota bacterium]|nr:MAG: hypothetical protein DRP90_08030 [Planctomycetota bacterium]
MGRGATGKEANLMEGDFPAGIREKQEALFKAIDEGAGPEEAARLLEEVAPPTDAREPEIWAFAHLGMEAVLRFSTKSRMKEAAECLGLVKKFLGRYGDDAPQDALAYCEAACTLVRMALLKEETAAREAEEGARGEWKKAVERGGPFAGRLATMIALAWFMLLDFEAAGEWVKKSRELDPRPISALLEATYVTAAKGPEEGKKAFEAALKEEPSPVEVFHCLLLFDFFWPYSGWGGRKGVESLREMLRAYRKEKEAGEAGGAGV